MFGGSRIISSCLVPESPHHEVVLNSECKDEKTKRHSTETSVGNICVEEPESYIKMELPAIARIVKMEMKSKLSAVKLVAMFGL